MPHRKQNSFLHGNRLRQDLVIPEPEDAEALRLQPRGPLLVVRGLGLVMPAIQFKHESLLKANQVNDEPPQRHLSPKFARCQSAASQKFPQFFFGVGGTASQMPGFCGRFDVVSPGHLVSLIISPPHPNPLPPGEREELGSSPIR